MGAVDVGESVGDPEGENEGVPEGAYQRDDVWIIEGEKVPDAPVAAVHRAAVWGGLACFSQVYWRQSPGEIESAGVQCRMYIVDSFNRLGRSRAQGLSFGTEYRLGPYGVDVEQAGKYREAIQVGGRIQRSVDCFPRVSYEIGYAHHRLGSWMLRFATMMRPYSEIPN